MDEDKNNTETEPVFTPPAARRAPWRLSLATFGVAVAGLTACGGSNNNAAPGNSEPPAAITVANPAGSCNALAGTTVPAASIGLPTRGAAITSAALQARDVATGTPEYCQVQGEILAANAADPAIRFQLNLPSQWNVKALQYGGGGFNGTLITGLAVISSGPSDIPTPLAKGYATYGDDAGHQTPGGTFFLNDQAAANYSGESVKRTRDTAMALLQSYYKAPPWKVYYQGASKGGQEGLYAAQRHAGDFDGVIAYYPALRIPSLTLAWHRMWQPAYRTPGGYPNPAKQALVKAKVMEACDLLDGLADGIVSNTVGCAATFDVGALRCPEGADTGDSCLSDAQINTFQTAASPMEFAFPMANGVTSIGGFPAYQGGELYTWLDAAGTGTAVASYGFFDGIIKFYYYKDAAAISDGFDYRDWRPRVEEMSRDFDVSNPNLDTFRQRGGKLLMVQGTTDMLAPDSLATAYYKSLSDRYAADLPTFMRYYVVPGFGHGWGDFQSTWDSLSALEAWAERGEAPTNQITVDANAATRGRARPLCEYPAFPRYNGSGAPNLAASFNCVTP